MTPTLYGRLQTHLVLLSSVGVAWTLAITPLLPRPTGTGLGWAYRVTLETAITMTLLGIGWEMIYHGLQQLRWDKDWPSLLDLLVGVVEAIPVWLVLHAVGLISGSWGPSSRVLSLYATYFTSSWLIVWLVSQGPIRVVQLRWRFEGGCFSRRPADAIVPFIVTNIGMVFALAALWLTWQ